jgi:hypothetical protein
MDKFIEGVVETIIFYLNTKSFGKINNAQALIHYRESN